MIGDKKRSDLVLGVVMPVCNCLKYTKQALASIHSPIPFHLIVIDNGSSDGTQEFWEKGVAHRFRRDTNGAIPKSVIYRRHDDNWGVPRSWNVGIAKAFELECDVVLVINNDVVLAKDTIQNLLNWWTGGGIITVTNVGWKRDALVRYQRKPVLVPTPTFIGFLIDEETIRRVGWFDEKYKVGYFEDLDYIERCQQAKVPTMMALDAPVAHYGSRAICEGGVKHRPTFAENQRRFESKYNYIPGFVDRERLKLLWVGDAACQTGFGRVSENILRYLHHKYDVHVLALNYHGDPHTRPYPLYPAPSGGDWQGYGRYVGLVKALQPNVIIINNDTFIVKGYLEKFHKTNLVPNIPVLGYMPVDARNIRYDWIPSLDLLHTAILYTEFGKREFREAGFEGRIEVVPHGVDLSIYHPIEKSEARKTLGLEHLLDHFIVGNVNNDQGRKRQDLTIEYFCRWVKEYDIPDNVLLFLHCKTVGRGYDIEQLMQWWGHHLYGDRDRLSRKRLIVTGKDVMETRGVAETHMKSVYGAIDLHVSTTMGEGWGLTTMESMACGVPNIVPDYSALGEWTGDGVCKVPCTAYQASPGNINTIAGVVDKKMFIEAMDNLYRNDVLRQKIAEAGRKVVQDPKYKWSQIAGQFDELISNACSVAKPRLVEAV